MDVMISTIGKNKGAMRVWLEGKKLEKAGFEPKTRYQITTKDGAIVLVKHSVGFRIVSSRKRNEREIPIIDINSAELLSMFSGLSEVRVIFKAGEIHILPLASELRARERFERTKSRIESGEPLQFGSLAHGGGVLTEALHEGFQSEGVKCELAFANEIREDLTEQAMTVNRAWTLNTMSLCGKMQELAFDEYVMRNLPHVDILEAGLPCSGASVAGRAKRGLEHPEAHPEVGHLVLPFLSIIARVNPTAIVLENVVPYSSSASMDIIRNQLRDMQYEVQETVVDGGDWNSLEHRKRMVMVAVTKGVSLDLTQLERPAKVTRTLGEILEPMALDDSRWSTMQGLKDRETRTKEQGKNFNMQIFNAASDKIGTLTKGVSKCRVTDPKISHPEHPDLLRNPLAIEHARAKDVPVHLIEGLSETIAHELLGQSINFKPFVSVGKLIAQSLKKMRKVVEETIDVLPLFQLAS